ncbi:TPA: hypothetical protein ACXIR0_002038, partial [Neisseria meningitidis]
MGFSFAVWGYCQKAGADGQGLLFLIGVFRRVAFLHFAVVGDFLFRAVENGKVGVFGRAAADAIPRFDLVLAELIRVHCVS